MSHEAMAAKGASADALHQSVIGIKQSPQGLQGQLTFAAKLRVACAEAAHWTHLACRDV